MSSPSLVVDAALSAPSQGVDRAKGRAAHGCCWSDVPLAPPDPILGLNAMFQQDTNNLKVNLGVGAYRTEDGSPYVLPLVRSVEKELASSKTNYHEYLPIAGYPDFIKATASLILGKDSQAIKEGRVVTVQALSGTGALRVGFTFLNKFYAASSNVLIPKPTWTNHKNVVIEAGFPPASEYRYFDAATGGLDFQGLKSDLEAAVPGSIVLLHGCAHNPTGADPTEAQWQVIKEICIRKRHLPFFDVAYQGFATGDLSKDARAVQMFADSGIDMIVTQSYAKNMGLYGERIGALNFVCSRRDVAAPVLSQLKRVIRPMYSNPPAHGAKIVARILSDPELYSDWQKELEKMSGRILEMRRVLRAKLEGLGTPGSWNRITNQIGMFSFTGLTAQQVEYIRKKHHVYMTSNGRISMAGLNHSNIEHVANAINDAVVNVHAMNKL